MARVQYGSIVTNLKGSIGGTTYAQSRAGGVAKNRSIGRKNQSSATLAALNRSKQASTLWTSLTASERNAWNTFASAHTHADRFGNVQTLTGYNWFVMVNRNRISLGVSLSSTVPAYVLPDAMPEVFVTLSASTILLSWSTPVNDAVNDLLIFITRPTRRQATYDRGGYLLIDKGTAAYSTSIDITTFWEQTTGLTWADISSSNAFNINAFVVPVSKTSYISGVGQTAFGNVPTAGIGFMAIGSTFIVA